MEGGINKYRFLVDLFKRTMILYNHTKENKMITLQEELKNRQKDYQNLMLGGFVSNFVFTPIVGIPMMLICHFTIGKEIDRLEEALKETK